MIKDYITGAGRTEDGDYCYRLNFECDTIQEARELSAHIKTRYRRDAVWDCKGGKFVYSFGYTVDQVEVAIERRNDEWASRQQEIEDYFVGRVY